MIAATPPRPYIGVDLSLTSPALAVVWVPPAPTPVPVAIEVHTFQQRKRETVGTHTVSPMLTVHVHPTIPTGEVPDVHRYVHIVTRLVDVVKTVATAVCGDPETPVPVDVTIEQYAFGTQSAHTYKLQELGGVFKYVLYSRFGAARTVRVQTVAINRWKAQVESGRASKFQVVQALVRDTLRWSTDHQWTRLVHEVFGIPSTSRAVHALTCALFHPHATDGGRPPTEDLAVPNPPTEDLTVPNPLQDMFDAMGIALYPVLVTQPGRNQRPKKTKKAIHKTNSSSKSATKRRMVVVQKSVWSRDIVSTSH